jgi:hypothetical protein
MHRFLEGRYVPGMQIREWKSSPTEGAHVLRVEDSGTASRNAESRAENRSAMCSLSGYPTRSTGMERELRSSHKDRQNQPKEHVAIPIQGTG